MSESEITNEPRTPEVGDYVRSIGRLLRVEDVTPTPPPPVKVYVFEDVTARVEILSASGVLIDERSTYTEFYGEGEAVASAIENAKRIAEELGPGVVVAVRRIVNECRAKRIPGWHPSAYDGKFIAMEPFASEPQGDEIVWRSDRGLIAPAPGDEAAKA